MINHSKKLRAARNTKRSSRYSEAKLLKKSVLQMSFCKLFRQHIQITTTKRTQSHLDIIYRSQLKKIKGTHQRTPLYKLAFSENQFCR